MNRKIVLIDPVECHHEGSYERINISTNYSGTSIGIRDPLGLEYISGYLKSHQFDVEIIVKNDQTDDELIQRIIDIAPSIVAFSVWSYMFDKVVQLANLVKQGLPNVFIVLGGYHPSFNPDIVRHDSIDFVSIGEGEVTLYELATALQDGYSEERLRKIKGISFLDSDGNVFITRERERLKFSELPFPDRPKEIVALSKITGLTNPSPGHQVSPLQISYSRGCPKKCEFCPSGVLWKQRVEYRDVNHVIDEILDLQNKFGTNYVYFSDLTFNLNPDKVIELCNAIIDRRVSISWSAMVKIDDDFEKNKNTFDLMKRAGCTRLAFGIEGFDDDNKLKEWNSVESISQNICYVDSLGIVTRAFLLMGFPFESKSYYQNLLLNLKKLPIDNIRLAFVVPFSGTALYEEFKDVIDKDFSLYTGEYPILPTSHMSKDELIETRKKLVEEFYNSNEYITRVIEKVNKHPHLFSSFNYFFSNNLIEEKILSTQSMETFIKGVKR